MKGTKRTSVIAIALALVLALSVLVGAGVVDPNANENGAPVNNEGTEPVSTVTISVVCDCHGNPVDAAITGTAAYELDSDSVVQPTPTPSAEPAPTPTTTVEPSEQQEQQEEQQEEPKQEEQQEEQEQPAQSLTKDINGETVETSIKENNATYNLKSITITSVTATGFTAKDTLPMTIDAVDIVGGTVTITMTNPAPSISNVNWNVTKGTEGYGVLTYSADEMTYAVLIRDDKAVDDVKNGNFPTVLGTTEQEIKQALSAYDGELKPGGKPTIWFPDGYGISKSDDPNAPYPYTAKFGDVTNIASDRVIVAVNSHGIATAQVINKCFSYTIDPASGWSQYKDITVTITDTGRSMLTSKGAKNIELVRTDNEGKEVVVKDVPLTGELTTIEATASVDGDYTVRAYFYSYSVRRGWEKAVVESLTFNVPQIDNNAPTIGEIETGDVINHVDVTATDTYSGVAGIYLSKVNFGYNTATTDTIKIYEKQQNEDGTDKWVESGEKTLNAYQGIYVKTDGVVICTNEIKVSSYLTLSEYPTAAELTDEKIAAAEKSAQEAAVKAAKDYFNDNSNKNTIAGFLTADSSKEFDPAENNPKTVTLPIEGNGSYDAVAVWAKDAAGNCSDIKVITAAGEGTDGKMVIDNTAPVVNSVEVSALNADSYSKSSTITVTAKITEDYMAGVYAVLFNNDGSVVEGKEKIDLSLSSGAYKAEVKDVPDGEGYYVVVYAEDQAGNKSYAEAEDGGKIPNQDAAKTAAFNVDTVAPEIAALTFAPADDKYTGDKYYFNAERKLEINVNELHLASGVFVYKNLETNTNIEVKLDWGGENGSVGNIKDNLFSYDFNENGKYQLVSMTLTDKAGNETVYSFDGKTEGVEKPVDMFVIDKTAPAVKVVYSNQTPANGKYFNADRTATITVTEHNFNEEYTIVNKDFKVDENTKSGTYIIITQNDKDAHGDIANLDIDKEWTAKENTDEHTLNITYKGSVNYVFNVIVVDRAGNQSADVDYDGNKDFAPEADEDFDVDKQAPTITITGVTNGSAYNGEVGGTIEYKDANFDSATVRLMRADRNGVYDVTAQHTTALPTAAPGGTVDLVNFDRLLTNDGIYTLTATVVDKAGNTAEQSVTFSVNRFGSTYKFDDYLASICDQHIKSVTDDLRITEINPDSITAGTVTITRNGKVIDSGDIAAVLQRSGSASGGWYEYLYTIGKDLFKEDGMYRIVVSSKDAAGNEPNSENDEEFEIVFWVDDTPADIAGIQGLEDAIINAENHTVKFTVRDNIGLKSVTVYCDGKEIAKFGENNFTAGDLVDAQFTISEASSAQHIRIVAEDLSGNVLDTDGTIEGSANTTVSFERDVTVSTNFFVRWFANKPLFFGSIAVIVAAGAGIYFIVAKRRKKEEAAAE